MQTSTVRTRTTKSVQNRRYKCVSLTVVYTLEIILFMFFQRINSDLRVLAENKYIVTFYI